MSYAFATQRIIFGKVLFRKARAAGITSIKTSLALMLVSVH
jgi:hypothetical protein